MVEALAERVQGAGADIAENDTQGHEGEGPTGSVLMIRHGVVGGAGRRPFANHSKVGVKWVNEALSMASVSGFEKE